MKTKVWTTMASESDRIKAGGEMSLQVTYCHRDAVKCAIVRKSGALISLHGIAEYKGDCVCTRMCTCVCAYTPKKSVGRT